MNPGRFFSNTPRNVTILALGVSVILGIFRLIPLLILVWIAALAYIIISQYTGSKTAGSKFVCLDCATIHHELRCPNCGSSLKKLNSRTNNYGY